MASLSHILAALESANHLKGRQFEQLVAWWLQNSPVFRRQQPALKQVWLWDDWPGRWGPDCGIDLVVELEDGQLWAVQAKHYDPAYPITKQDVDSFLSESARPQISRRLLVATTDKLAGAAARVIAAAEKPVDLYLRSTLEAEPVQWPERPGHLRAPRAKRKQPLPHQRRALAAIARGLKQHERGTAVMACGTGKTLVALWSHERRRSQRTLVLVPSLALMAQTIREWSANGRPFAFLPVCSETTVAEGADALRERAQESALPTATTDPQSLAAFLAGAHQAPRVVFCTYQSLAVVEQAQACHGAPEFDLVIADEAHQCTGPSDAPFALVLDGARVRAQRRLFMTATPRMFTRKGGGEVELVSMDDPLRFGPELFRLDFAQAIDPPEGEPLLCDYRVLVAAVSDQEVQELAADGVFVKLLGGEVEGRRMDARTLGAHIVLAKAARTYGLRRIITFHSRVKSAERFSRDFPLLCGWLPPAERPAGELWCEHVSGEMAGRRREALLGAFRRLEDTQLGVLSNARCLAEGVDVPAIDGVAFIDPRGSEVDIVQAVGRAIRKAPGKSVGTIVVPVFLGEHDDPQQALEEGAFQHVWRVLRALRAHDSALGRELDEMRRKLGSLKARAQVPEKLVIELPARSVDRAFHEAFAAQLLDHTTASWNEWLGLLEAYAQENPQRGAAPEKTYVTEDGIALGNWVNNQRSKCKDPQKRAQLEALPGWVWSKHEADWSRHFAALEAYAQENPQRGAAPEKTYVTEDGLPLGQWVSVQRGTCQDPQRRAQLEALPGWAWNKREADWNMYFAALEVYAQAHPEVGAAPSTTYVTDDGLPLGKWVITQRSKCKEPQRRAQLEALPGWAWNKNDADWNRSFAALEAYAQENPQRGAAPEKTYVTEDGLPLGQWVAKQRRTCKEPQRRAQLEALPGWVWNKLEADWNRHFSALEAYAQENPEVGAAPSTTYITEDGLPLGKWVAKQRRTCKEPQRRAQLEALPGWVWNKLEADWNRHFSALEAYAQENPEVGAAPGTTYITEDGLNLGQWVATQRAKCKDPQRRAQLEVLPGWVWSKLEADWNRHFAALQVYAQATGNSKPERTHVTEDGIPLGQWVRVQRGTCQDPQRRAQLEALPGWYWSPKNQ